MGVTVYGLVTSSVVQGPSGLSACCNRYHWITGSCPGPGQAMTTWPSGSATALTAGSRTVKITGQVALLPAASVAVTVMVCVIGLKKGGGPRLAGVFATGSCVMCRAGNNEQLSVTEVAVNRLITSGITAPGPNPVSGPGQTWIVGGVMSLQTGSLRLTVWLSSARRAPEEA